ncbi:hypothetical protein CBR_g26160, partial [Chara braunii]
MVDVKAEEMAEDRVPVCLSGRSVAEETRRSSSSRGGGGVCGGEGGRGEEDPRLPEIYSLQSLVDNNRGSADDVNEMQKAEETQKSLLSNGVAVNLPRGAGNGGRGEKEAGKEEEEEGRVLSMTASPGVTIEEQVSTRPKVVRVKRKRGCSPAEVLMLEMSSRRVRRKEIKEPSLAERVADLGIDEEGRISFRKGKRVHPPSDDFGFERRLFRRLETFSLAEVRQAESCGAIL